MAFKSLFFASAVVASAVAGTTPPVQVSVATTTGDSELFSAPRHLLLGSINTDVKSNVDTNTGTQSTVTGDTATHNGNSLHHDGDKTDCASEDTEYVKDTESSKGDTTHVDGHLNEVKGDVETEGPSLEGATLFEWTR